MNTLTMALAAVMLAGSAPEKVSGEVEQRLDLSGKWEGTWASSKWGGKLNVAFGDSVLTLGPERRHPIEIPCAITDMGSKTVLVKQDGPVYRATYRAEGDRVMFWLVPSNFQSDPTVLTLRRAKPRQ